MMKKRTNGFMTVLFLIRKSESGTSLFTGRVWDPAT